MRAVVWLLLLAVVAVVAATTLGSNDGLVSVYWSGWRMDTSLNLFLLALVGACFLIVSVIQAATTLTGLPKRAREWRVQRRDRTAQTALRESLAQYFGGRYTRSQSAAMRALSIQSETPELARDEEFTVLAHLLVAGSAHRLHDRARRDAELQRALAIAGHGAQGRAAEEGAQLLAAEWALEDRDAARALALLAELPPGVARRTHALRMKLQATRLGQQPQEALKTARLLAKHQGFSKVAALGLLRSLAFESLETARDADQLRRVWHAFDASDRRDAYVAARAARKLCEFGEVEEARSLIRPFWERLDELSGDERAAIAEALTASIAGIGADWLPRLESAARAFPREGSIAYAVGSVLAERQLYGKARQLLETAAGDDALARPQRRHAWRTLARLAETEHDAERAARCYAQAASLG